MKSRRLSDSVVVITGASSGIGRAAAVAFAREGATLVIGARRERALRDVAADCERAGGRALAIRTDVTDEQAVQNLARAAAEHFGRLDVWVNNAAVTLFARFEEAPMEVYRRVVETNLFGYIHGARAALPYFREQGSGVLINVASVVSETPQPYTSAYTITKFAVQGLADSLRMELSLDDDHDIHVCTVLPASIATPLFDQAANYTGRRVKPLDPAYPAEQVAEAIVSVARRPRREAVVGNAGRALRALRHVAPDTYERRMARHIFQHGALGGATPEEFHEGSPRVEEYLERYGSHRRRWDSPGADAERPEAEWGFEPTLYKDIERIASHRGYRIRRVRFDEPADPSPLVAELYRDWYRQRRIIANRLVVSSFMVMEPYWTLRTGSAPFWMTFNKEPSAEALENYIEHAGPFDEIYMMLFSHGVNSVGLVPIERWRSILSCATRRGDFIGVDPDRYPRDFAAFIRYNVQIKRKIASRYPMPGPMSIDKLDQFLQDHAHRFAVRWIEDDREVGLRPPGSRAGPARQHRPGVNKVKNGNRNMANGK